MPENQMPGWAAAIVLLYGSLLVFGIPTFLYGVPSGLQAIARQLRRIADAKEKEKK